MNANQAKAQQTTLLSDSRYLRKQLKSASDDPRTAERLVSRLNQHQSFYDALESVIEAEESGRKTP